MKMNKLMAVLITLLIAVPAVISVTIEQTAEYKVPAKPKYDTRVAMHTWGCSDVVCKDKPSFHYKDQNRANYRTYYGLTQLYGYNWGRYTYTPNIAPKNVPSKTPMEQWSQVETNRFLGEPLTRPDTFRIRT